MTRELLATPWETTRPDKHHIHHVCTHSDGPLWEDHGTEQLTVGFAAMGLSGRIMGLNN